MKISEKCYVIYGLSTLPPWMVNSGFIVGKEKTLIVDCGGNYLSAKTIYGYAKNIKPNNKLIAINTEPHFDHMGGNCFFREMEIDIYGHCEINRGNEDLEEIKKEYSKCITSELRRKEKEEELVFYNTSVVNPNIKISSNISIELGEMEVDIILTPGHTKMNLSVYVPNENILYCGDLIVTDYYPNLEDGGKDDWEEWLLSIDKIKKIAPEMIIPGHGEIVKGNGIQREIYRTKSILNSAIDNAINLFEFKGKTNNHAFKQSPYYELQNYE
jgi:glyoxylase-like metal-dependent hydrolase (beta-lactamase superfamily II)